MYTLLGSVQGIRRRKIGNARIVLHWRPPPVILDVAPKFLEPVAAIFSRKEIDASVVLEIFDADKHSPRLVDAM
jgi:hypothetical protein